MSKWKIAIFGVSVFFILSGCTNHFMEAILIKHKPGIPGWNNLVITVQNDSLKPFSPLDNTFAWFTVEVSGFQNASDADQVELAIDGVSGFTLSGYDTSGMAVNGIKTFIVEVHTTTPVSSGTSVTFTITDLLNIPTDGYNPYSGSPKTVTINFADGSSGNPISVTGENFSRFNSLINLSGHYKLAEDINASTTNWNTVGPFSGIFDGNNKTISNLHLSENSDYYGMFSFMSGTIQNLNLVNCTIAGNSAGNKSVGYIAGNNSGTIRCCTITSSNLDIQGNNGSFGCIAGVNSGKIQDCYVHSTISNTGSTNPNTNIGGVAGQITGSSSKIQNCLVNVSIYGSNGSNSCFGGIVGLADNGNVENCVVLDSIITTMQSNSDRIGRVAGIRTTGVLSGNYAGNTTIKYQADNSGSGGLDKTITTTGVQNGIDGEGITSPQWTNPSWWSGTAHFTDPWWNDKLPP